MLYAPNAEILESGELDEIYVIDYDHPLGPQIHLQGPANDWLEAVKAAPPGYFVKSVNNVHLLRDAAVTRPDTIRGFRYWHDPLQYFSNDYGQMSAKWRDIFSRFVNDTFLSLAWAIDIVEGHNEYLAEPIIAMPQHELDERFLSDIACLDVWEDLQRQHPELAHIRIAIGNIGVGNSYEPRWGQLCVERGAVLGYHSYIHTKRKVFPYPGRDPQDWRYHSGRWAWMDSQWSYKPVWALTEGGPYASAVDGWKADACLDGNINATLEVWRSYIRDIMGTPAYAQGRVMGPVAWFTVGAGDWPTFNTNMPMLRYLAEHAASLGYNGLGPPSPPPLPGELWHELAWRESVERQQISLNPAAGLQRAIFRDGYTPVQSEFRLDWEGRQRAVQAAEYVGPGGGRRVYWVDVPAPGQPWGQPHWFTLN
jgi:hypothetical protein